MRANLYLERVFSEVFRVFGLHLQQPFLDLLPFLFIFEGALFLADFLALGLDGGELLVLSGKPCQALFFLELLDF